MVRLRDISGLERQGELQQSHDRDTALLKPTGPIIWIGAGKMGGAILTGALARGLDAVSVRIQDPGPPPEVVTSLVAHGLSAEPRLAPTDRPASLLLIAVKPQVMSDVLPTLRPLMGPDTLALSIAAGKPVRFYEEHLPSGTAVVRAMPNTPAAVGKGITVCCANAHVTARQRALCEALLASVGQVDWLDDESLMDAVTAVSGSGPAYVFHMVEALAAAGEASGLARDQAMRLARATVVGAGALLDDSELEADILRRNVTSPGGTTAAGLEVLMREPDGLGRLMRQTVAAATKRGVDLAG